MSEIISYIEKTHHAFLWENLPSTDMLLNSIMKTRDKKQTEFLLKLKEIFEQIKKDLENHLESEEYDLFKLVKEFEKHPRKNKKIPQETIIQKIDKLYEEHDHTKILLNQIRNFTDEYKLPENASKDFKKIYENLKAIESDLQEHIYIETTILLPKVRTLLIK